MSSINSIIKLKQTPIFSDDTNEIEISENIFGIKEIRFDLIKRYLDWQRINRIAGTKAVKGLSEVSGTGAKPHKQKGTGRARAGTKRAPQHRGGAVAHDVATVHNPKMTKKEKKLALKHVLSYKVISGSLVLVDNYNNVEPKTKQILQKLKAHNINNCLLIDSDISINLKKACANLYKIDCLPAKAINVYSILNHENLILSKSACENITEYLNI
ncbi:MAG: 50S ribosomal protein L4 [Rickettsiales bacterium]